MLSLNRVALFLLTVIMIFNTSCSSTKNVKVDERYGKRIAYINKGSGSPAIVFESGFDSGMETWDGILDSLATYTKVYAYNRPGYGKSNMKDAPQSFEEVARQLHSNLKARKVKPPYVLVGYAAGALMVNMYVRLYPEEVKGVVMIEPTHPNLYEYLKNNEALLYDILVDNIDRGQRLYELKLIKSSSEEFMNAASFPDVPLNILMASRHSSLESESLKEKTLEYHEQLKNMSAEGKRYLIPSSSRHIHRSSPEAVIEKILELVER